MPRNLLILILTISAASAAVAEDCPPIGGGETLLQPGKILLLGEIHGTIESPDFTGDIACHAAEAGLSVIVGLELLFSDQLLVDAFLDSAGTDEDRAALISSSQWQRGYQDGRTSRAMVELIDTVRRLRRQELAARIVLFDDPGTLGGQARDRDMGRMLARTVEAFPEAFVVVLTGNRHSRISRGLPRNAEFEPMGLVLSRTSGREVISLDAGHRGGSAWVCAPDCGPIGVPGRDEASAWTMKIDDANRPAGHSGWYHVGLITASPPARFSSAEAKQARASIAALTPALPVSSAESKPVALPFAPDRPLSETEKALQGAWQAYDYGSSFKTWAFLFREHGFRADGGSDEWYEGRVVIREESEPAGIDFVIDDCNCTYKGMSSEAIFTWEDDSLVIAAPRPGAPRPTGFAKNSGQLMVLRKVGPE